MCPVYSVNYVTGLYHLNPLPHGGEELLFGFPLPDERGERRVRGPYSRTMVLVSRPIPSTSISISSPGCIGPTPEGVPAAMISPG